MSLLLPIIPAAEPPNVSGINRQYVVEGNGHRAILDGGPLAPADGIIEITAVVVTSADDDVMPVDTVDVPSGIEYAHWARAVKPASRDGFADTNDFLDLFDED